MKFSQAKIFSQALWNRIFSFAKISTMGTRVKTRLKDDGKPRHFIRQWRKKRGLTLEQLAGRLEVATSSISQLETGKQGYSQPMLEAIADALQCQPADLLMRDPTLDDAIWSIENQLKTAPPERVTQILAVVETMLRTGT